MDAPAPSSEAPRSHERWHGFFRYPMSNAPICLGSVALAPRWPTNSILAPPRRTVLSVRGRRCAPQVRFSEACGPSRGSASRNSRDTCGSSAAAADRASIPGEPRPSGAASGRESPGQRGTHSSCRSPSRLPCFSSCWDLTPCASRKRCASGKGVPSPVRREESQARFGTSAKRRDMKLRTERL